MKGAITERMDHIEDDILNRFPNLYCKKDFLKKLREAKYANADRRIFVLRDLACMINEVGYKCEYEKPFSYYVKIVNELDVPADEKEINERLVNTLNSVYSFYPQPDEFMKRIVDKLDPLQMEAISLQLRILRRFMKTVNVKENEKYYSKTLAEKEISEIDESVFDAMKKDGEESSMPPLVQAAYNLAKGIFVSPITTKEVLFLFAFAYGMRYYVSEKTADYRLEKDVEKNLFKDYYCDNLTRYMYSEDGGKSGNSDKEPSGVGLNPKNFVDVIFVYYLNKEGMEAPQKVSGFYAMIDRVKKEWKNKCDYAETRKRVYEDLSTGAYRNKIDIALNRMEEADFEKYILDNYYCDVRYTYTNKKTGKLQEGSKGTFEFQIAAKSAFEQYSEILEMIKDALLLPKDADFSKLDRRKNDFAVTQMEYLRENVPDSDSEYFKSLSKNVGNDPKKFELIIKNIEKRLDPLEALGVDNPLNLTRTKMIAAYYHYYCYVNEYENECDDGDGMWKNFRDVYEDMISCLDDYLDGAGYQRISTKNLYDMFVIFFAYCKINRFLD